MSTKLDELRKELTNITLDQLINVCLRGSSLSYYKIICQSGQPILMNSDVTLYSAKTIRGYIKSSAKLIEIHKLETFHCLDAMEKIAQITTPSRGHGIYANDDITTHNHIRKVWEKYILPLKNQLVTSSDSDSKKKIDVKIPLPLPINNLKPTAQIPALDLKIKLDLLEAENKVLKEAIAKTETATYVSEVDPDIKTLRMCIKCRFEDSGFRQKNSTVLLDLLSHVDLTALFPKSTLTKIFNLEG
jgi:hypothetical protein